MANEREDFPQTRPIRSVDDPDITMSADTEQRDPADEIPVPIAMSAAELDERAQAVEAVRGTATPSSNDDSEPFDSPRDA
jgi:hypothetical protein